jgi:chromosome segregation ATPase
MGEEELNQTPDQQEAPAGTPTPDDSPGQQVDWKSRALELEEQVDQLQSRYSGQQAVLQEAQEKKANLSNQMDEMQAEVDRLQHELEQTTSGRSELEEELQTAKSQAAELAAKQAKMDLVRKNYPDLLRFPLEALPDADDPEDLDAALGDFNEAVSSIVEEREAQIKAQLSEGAVPTPPAAQDESTALGEDIQDAAAKLSDLAGTDEFDEALGEFASMLGAEEVDKRYALSEDTLSGDLAQGAEGFDL